METTAKKDHDLNRLATEAQAQGSDRGTAQKFFREIYPFVQRVCKVTATRRASKQRAYEVTDLTQIVCGKIWASFTNFDPTKGKFTTWVWTLARNSWLDIIYSQHEAEIDATTTNDLLVSALSLEDQVNARLSLCRLKAFLSAHAFDLVLTNASGCSAQEIADHQGANLETVKSRVRTARARSIEYLNADLAVVAA